MGYLAGLSYAISRASGLPFPVVFKLPSIIADALTCALLWRISRAGPWIAVIFAWNLNATLISGHHCNTDSIYAMLCLASVYLISARGKDFFGGLVLGAAINVKLIPTILLIPMFALFHERRALAKFAAGLAIAAIPYLVCFSVVGKDFATHAFGYASFVDNWGVELFLQKLARYPRLSTTFGPAVDDYRIVGRGVIILAIVLLAMIARRRDMDRYTTAACAASLFLILTPGFGIQYTAFVTPLLLAASPMWGSMYAICASVFALCWYGLNWDGYLPITNPPGIQLHGTTMLAGLLSWGVVVAYGTRTLLRHRRSSPFPGARA